MSHSHGDLNEAIVKSKNGRYGLKIPWVPGKKITKSNEAQSRSHLKGVERKLERNPELNRAYQGIAETVEKGATTKWVRGRS